MMLAQEFLVDSGSKQYCQTDGVFDLIGNLEEWVLDDWQGRVGSLEGVLGTRSEHMQIVQVIILGSRLSHPIESPCVLSRISMLLDS